MCVEGSQSIAHLRGALKRGFLAKKKGISSACDRLRPRVTVGTPMGLIRRVCPGFTSPVTLFPYLPYGPVLGLVH